MGDVGWPGEGRIMIIKVSVVTIDSVRWEQNVGTLVSLGGNVLGYPLGIRFCDGRGAGGGGGWVRCCVVADLSQRYANGLVLTWRIAFLPMSMESRLGGQIWNLMPSGFCREECHENGGGL